MRNFDQLKYLLLFVLLSACASQQQTKIALGVVQFQEAFVRDCKNIKTIYEGHDSSGYFLINHKGGNHTKTAIDLKEMAAWLKQCGANLNTVSQVIE